MDWLKDHSYLAEWLALPLAIVVMILQNKGKKLAEIDWSSTLINLAFLTSMGIAFNNNFDHEARAAARGIMAFTLGAIIVHRGIRK